MDGDEGPVWQDRSNGVPCLGERGRKPTIDAFPKTCHLLSISVISVWHCEFVPDMVEGVFSEGIRFRVLAPMSSLQDRVRVRIHSKTARLVVFGVW
jgi:hypothetical protein